MNDLLQQKDKLEKQVQDKKSKENEKAQKALTQKKAGSNSYKVEDIPVLQGYKVNSKFTIIPDEAAYMLTIESQVKIEILTL